MTTRTLVVITALIAILPPQSSRAQINPYQSENLDFAPACPESRGVSDESLRSLASAVRGYVERDEIIGAELLVTGHKKYQIFLLQVQQTPKNACLHF